MKKQCKKKIAGLCIMILLAGMVFSGISAGALEPPTYDFKHWFREGNTSACVPKPAEDFLELTLETGEEISPENYTVAAAPNGMFYGRYYEDATIITLKEEYLQTLEDGFYRLESHFFAEERYSCEVTDGSLRSYGIEYLGMSDFYRVTRITYNGQNIDPAYYTTTDENGYQQILFNDEEYWKTLQPDLLRVYFAPDYLSNVSYLTIITPEPVSEEETTSDPPVSVIITPIASLPETPSVSSQEGQSLVSPTTSATSSDTFSSQTSGHLQTSSGEKKTNTAVAVTVAVIAVGVAAGCTALSLILLKRYRNRKEDK